jgi:hypothetical protein
MKNKEESRRRRGKKGGEPNRNSERKIQIAKTKSSCIFFNFIYDPQFF